MRKGIFFDFWGTLWISNLEDPSLNDVAKESSLLGLVQSESDAKLKARRWGGFPAHGVCTLVYRMLSLCPIFIISCSPQRDLDELLNAWGLLDCFEAVESTHKRNLSKVDALKQLCLEHQVEPILFVGDSFGDAQTSRDLSLKYVHLGKERDCLDVFGKDHPNATLFSNFASAYGYILKTAMEVSQKT